MKEYMKYIISTIVFLVVYTLVSYLLTKNIDFKMIIITSFRLEEKYFFDNIN